MSEFEHKTEFRIDSEGVRFHTFIAPGFLLTFHLLTVDVDKLCAEWAKTKEQQSQTAEQEQAS